MTTNLARIMKQKRVTQRQLSDLIYEHHGVRISRQTIQLFFTGSKRMHLGIAQLIADVLGCEVNEIDDNS